MPKPKLTFAAGLYDRLVPLFAGQVKPDDFDLEFLAINDPREIFDRMAGGLEFGASEMSSSEYISRFSAGECPFVAIPVFISRVFRHGFMCINRNAGIKSPKDLEGKRVGVPLYTMSAAVWARGHLQHEYGVDLSGIQWVQGAADNSGTHGNPTVMPLLKHVAIEQNQTGKSLSQLLDEGELDAMIGGLLPESLGRSPNVQRLFPNFHEVEREFFERTGIFPIMHLVVIRREIHEKHPFIADSFYKALCRSKELAIEHMRYVGAPRYMLPWMAEAIDEIDEVFGDNPWPYGVELNRPTLEALVTYLAEQHLIAKPMPIEDLFVPVSSPT